MKELTVNEIKTVNGGGGNVCWMIGGYLFGKAVDGLADINWGVAENSDMYIAP